MAAAASLTIPTSIVTPVQAYDARKVLSSTAGASNIAVDASANRITFDYEFPGNIDRVMEKLRARHVTGTRSLALSVPVKNLSGRSIDTADFVAHLNASPTVEAATYDGHAVTATIVAQTNAMRYIYEEIIIAGLMPLDIPTVAGPQEFVL
ncbi:MAG: hypothetical protein IAI50_01885 [Candidatus Eremiobacteraeota bacterium]|nr:hypothetical protein [Candidatus Eremiobacteraeota bacterium]